MARMPAFQPRRLTLYASRLPLFTRCALVLSVVVYVVSLQRKLDIYAMGPLVASKVSLYSGT